jgi:porin
MQLASCRSPVILTLVCTVLPVQAFEVNDRFSINGILAGAGQCQNVSTRLPAESYAVDGAFDTFDNACRGAMPFQLEASYTPDEASEFFVKFGFAAGNGLGETSPWVLVPWAAYLEDDVKDINGSNRDYLLAAWYRHTFSFANASTVSATLGILDSTDYLDGNEYANDEYTQFMNEAFVNAGGYTLPSYDTGAALEWASGPWSANVLGMNVAENDDANNYNFWGIQTGYRSDTRLGTGNYRIILAGTSAAFLDPAGRNKESRLGWGLSFDQEINTVIGAFLRFAWQQEDASVDYRAHYSGGFNFAGSGWGRDPDNIGIGYAYYAGGNADIENTRVFETYYRFGFTDHAGLTADVQYMKDNYTNASQVNDHPAGWIFGLRVTAGF